jgi:hypothetical protein
VRTASRKPCPAQVVGREPCRFHARRNSSFCAYHDEKTRTRDVDESRWCSWLSSDEKSRCQRWAMRVSDRCSQHDPERSADSLLASRVQRSARVDSLSDLAEWNDAERRRQIPVVASIARAWVKFAFFDSRRSDALAEFADALDQTLQPLENEEERDALMRRYDKAMTRIISLGLNTQDHIAPLATAWIESKKRLGDKEALRWARQGLETGVQRPHPKEDLDVLTAINASLTRQAQDRKISWSVVQRDVEKATGRKFGPLEDFTKWVVGHLGDLLGMLPPRAESRRRRKPQ